MAEFGPTSELGITMDQEQGKKPERQAATEPKPRRVKNLLGRGFRTAAVAGAAVSIVAGIGMGASRAEASQVERPPGVMQIVEQDQGDEINEVIKKSQVEIAGKINALYQKEIKDGRVDPRGTLSVQEDDLFVIDFPVDSEVGPDGGHTKYQLLAVMQGEYGNFDPKTVTSMKIEASNAGDATPGYVFKADKGEKNSWEMNIFYGDKGYGLTTADGEEQPTKKDMKHLDVVKDVLKSVVDRKPLEKIVPPAGVPERVIESE